MIDFTFIEKLEGYRLEGYVPDSKHSQSGVTIVSGFDLGQRSTAEIERAFPSFLADKLKPYVGYKGIEAQNFLDSYPLSISAQEALLVNQHAKENVIKVLESSWQSCDTYCDFEYLGSIRQTVVASVAFQYGNLETRTPNFWQQVTIGDWTAVLANLRNLRNFSDRYPTRRNKEANLLESWLKA